MRIQSTMERYGFRNLSTYVGKGFIVPLLLIAIACIASMFFATRADAQSTCPTPAEWNRANVCWTNPTQNTDNTPIPTNCAAGVPTCGKLAATRIEYGTCTATQAFGAKVGEITAAAPATQVTVSALVPQVYCFRGFSRNDVAIESIASNIVTKTVTGPTPKAPLLVTDASAFDIRTNSSGALVAQRIGVVPPGTVCTSEDQQTVNGIVYSRVDRGNLDVVNFTTAGDPWVPVVYAKCSG